MPGVNNNSQHLDRDENTPVISLDKIEMDYGISDISGSTGTSTNKPIQNDEVDSEDKRLTFSKVPRSKKVILILCVMANFLSACAFSLLRPFFPLEAAKKGMSLTMMGFVIGVYQLVICVSSPLMGQLSLHVGVKFVYISGMFVGGCCVILFGLLEKSPDGTIFLVMCILVRCVEAFGFAGFMTASMTIVSSEFEDYVGSVVALLRCSNSLGNMVGPVIGGVLFDIGGFGLPFYCLAVPTLLNVVFMFIALPSLECDTVSKGKKKTMFEFLRSPYIAIVLLTLLVAVSGLNAFLSVFAMYLEPFGLSSSVVGVIYIIAPFIYSLVSPIWGYIADVKGKPTILIVSGHLVFGIGWLIIAGPSAILPFVEYSLLNICIGAAVIGLSYGCLLITPMKCLVDGALELGFKKEPDTYAKVSGLYSSVAALAGFLGPFGGGLLMQNYGFSNVFLGVALSNFAMCLITLAFFSHRYFVRRKGLGGSSN